MRHPFLHPEVAPPSVPDSIDTREQQLTAEIAHLRARLALHESGDTSLSERLLLCLDQMLDCFGMFSSIRDENGSIVDFRIDYLNREACLNNHLPLAQQLGRGLCEILPAHRASGLLDRYREVVETGQPLELESVYYEDNYEDEYGGRRRLSRAFDIRAWKMGDGFASTWRDITALKQEQEVDEERRRWFRLIADSIPHLVWTTLPDGYCDFLSRQWAEYTGVPQEEQHGDGWIKAIHPDDRDQAFAVWLAALEGRATYDVEYRLRRHDGVYRWFKAKGQPIRDAEGRIIRWFGTSTDIEDQKRAQEEILEARWAAESANQAKDHFLAILSHELRTPLTPVLTAAQRLESDPGLKPELRKWAEMIRRNLELETRLIDDLLDHTRISRGKVELRLGPVDLHETIHQTLAICESDALVKRLDLVADLGAAHPWVQADPARLQQVLWNLVKNAVKFTPEGGTVTVRTWDADDPADTEIRVEVRDDGVGIDPERLPWIFDAFEQGGRSVTREFGGLGLGLAISKGLAELHGGTLTAASNGRGRGAAFSLRLPSLDAMPAPEPMAEAAAPEPHPASPERAPSDLRILIVDDHRDTLTAMADLLEIFGYAPRTADSVAAALEAAEGERFDLVISDIGLPDGSGLDLMRQLLALYPVRGIALSGFGMEEDLVRSREAGFVEHLTKPIDLAQLERALARALAAAG
jgi:PAS domain S-box-containing protein